MEQSVIQSPQLRSWKAPSLGAPPQRQRTAASEEFKPPLDIREWVDSWRLVAWIEEEAERFAGIDPAGTERLLPPAGFDPSMMLRLLTFAYACRVFESDDIVQRCHSEAIFGGMCEAEIPSAQQLRSFRRSHRALLEKILARVILRAVRDRFGLEAAMPYPELEADLRDRASERLNIARHMDQP